MASSIEEARLAIIDFLAQAKSPAVIEPGERPFAVHPGNYAFTSRGTTLLLEVWDNERNLARRLRALTRRTRSTLEFEVERFGKRSGTLTLADLAAASAHSERASKLSYREWFRRALARQFPTWRVDDVSAGPDLEHSLSPSYARALLRLGTRGLAAIGAPPESEADGVLTFGLLWLDYLRRRERNLALGGLVVFVPAGEERVTCLRARHLNPAAVQVSVFATTPDGYEDAVDLADYGNLDTHLEHCFQPDQRAAIDVPGADRVTRGDGSLSYRVRGLEIARQHGAELMWGLETRRIATASNTAEIAGLAAEVARMRSPEAGDRLNPLYTRNPEGWLESQVRSAIQSIDAGLEPAPVYGQVPAFTAGDRGVIDLLAADRTGRLAVIEVKASEDIHLPMQALDYWMRVRWHAERAEFGSRGYFPGKTLRACAPKLYLVAPALDFHPSNETVLRYFSGSIETLRVGVGPDWRDTLKVMFRHGNGR